MNEIKTHNAKAILQEALDTITATFWIKGDEVMLAEASETYEYDKYDWSDWEAINKAILIDLDADDYRGKGNPETGKGKVIGVCSIGAIALANVTLYDEPLQGFNEINERDIETWKASAALLMEILARDEYFYDGGHMGTEIAAWNDAESRTREQVIEVFKAALKSPLLDSTVPSEITYTYGNSEMVRRTSLYFGNDELAGRFIDGKSNLRVRLANMVGEAAFSIAPIQHNALVGA